MQHRRNKEPIKYPTHYTLKISPSDEKYIEKKYIEWEEKIKELHTNFKGEKSNVHVHSMLILKSLISPPTIGFCIGILLGVSRIRDLIWDGNIYFENLIDGLNFFQKALTPFLFLVIGVACMPKSEEENKKKKTYFNNKNTFYFNFCFKIFNHSCFRNFCCFYLEKIIQKRM